MEFEKEYGYIKIKGKYYSGISKDGKVIFTEEKDAKNKIKKAKEMAEKLKDNLDREAVLVESMMNLDEKDFGVLNKILSGKIKYKPKTRAHHCVDMKIGNFVLPIVD